MRIKYPKPSTALRGGRSYTLPIMDYHELAKRLQASQRLYRKLNQLGATQLDEMVNSSGQRIEFFEHPIYGEDFPVIVSFPDYQVAFPSDFFECDDMLDGHGEYAPHFDQPTQSLKCFFEL